MHRSLPLLRVIRLVFATGGLALAGCSHPLYTNAPESVAASSGSRPSGALQPAESRTRQDERPG
jgi:hypothetical protein